MQKAVSNATTMEFIHDASRKDSDINQKLNGKISKSTQYFNVRHELSVVLLRGTRIVILTKLRKRTLQLAYEGHHGIYKTKLRLREKVGCPV